MTEPTCRKCGCTQECACFDELRGCCSWVEDGLCSHCQDTMRLLEEFELAGADEAGTLAVDAHHVDQLLKMLRYQPRPADDVAYCFACLVPFKDGDEVLDDVTEGTMHFACCGPDRESYVGADGEPLKDGEPIPKPWIWHPEPSPIEDAADSAVLHGTIRTVREALGDGTRAPDFEQYLIDYQAMLKSYDHVADADTRQLVRFMHIFSVAAVEGARQASDVRGTEPGDAVRIINLMVKGATISIAFAICSVLRDGTPAEVLQLAMRRPFEEALAEVIRAQGLI